MKELHVFEFMGRRVVDSEGKPVGRIEEIEAERGDEVCLIKNYLVEHRGILDRISTWALAVPMQKMLSASESSKPYRVPWDKMDLSDPEHPRILVPKSELKRKDA
jgi:sporulation protein YlmC with PRC-barrel domain